MDRYRIVVGLVTDEKQLEDGLTDGELTDGELTDGELEEDRQRSLVFVARCPEMGIQATGPSRAEAVERLEKELTTHLDSLSDQGLQPAAPIDELDLDGKIDVKVSTQLHRDLLFMAKEADIGLETLVVELLARSVATRPTRRGGAGQHEAGRGRRRGRPDQQRYHNIMENRADFIQYVREQHEGGPQGPGRGGGRGGSSGRGRGRR